MPPSSMKITMIAHSTVLIETDGRRVLTDPWFGTWGNPAYVRVMAPARDRAALANVDLVLVSHNHWDHTDRSFFRMLSSDVPVLAPRESAGLTRLKGARNVIGVGKWESRTFSSLRVTAVPAHHLAFARGYVIESGGRVVYFAGDTYAGAFMKRIGEKLRVDAALMPVATWRLPLTMGESGAVEAVHAFSPRIVIPIHLGIRPRNPMLRGGESPGGFAARLSDANLKTEVRMLGPGESVEL